MAARSSLTILFENPFWIGLYERIDGDKYEKSVLEILQMNEYVNYLAEIIPEKDSLQLVKSEADKYASALSFLKDTVSQHDSWKVQEVLAMAFDNHCKIIGYDVGLPLIKEWLNSDCANVRRAVSEGLRIWTSRPYFRDNPQIAIQLLSAHREDASEYVRKSVGNALRDISKKYPELISAELNLWDLSSKEIKQVYKLASKFLDSN